MDSSSSGQNAKNSSATNANQSPNPKINQQLVQPNSPHKNQTADFYIIRVTYETENIELDGIVLYKSIMLGNNERTPQVIKNSMLKLGLDGDPDKYTLAQVLPDKELVMPANANVYYAVNTTYNLNFILRPKRETNWGFSATADQTIFMLSVNWWTWQIGDFRSNNESLSFQ